MPKRFSIAALLLVLLFGAFQSVPSGPALATCATCNGAGQAELPCEYCEGDGKGPCVECTDVLAQRTRRIEQHVLSHIAPDSPTWLQASRDALQRSSFGKIEWGGLLSPVPGRTSCVARCTEGKAPLNHNRSCKACDEKGWLTCSPCKGKGQAACTSCSGRRSATVSCPECAGSRQARAATTLTAADAEACTWCVGKEIRECKACDENGQRDSICTRCGGNGKHVCGQCRGTQRVGCNKCKGTKDLSTPFISERCGQCDKNGTLECLECKRGVAACQSCGGVGRGKLNCSACLGGKAKLASCAGCWDGRAISWSVASERLLAEGRKDVAIAFLTVELRREEALATRMSAAAKDQAEQREIARAMTKKRTELQARIEAARKTP